MDVDGAVRPDPAPSAARRPGRRRRRRWPLLLSRAWAVVVVALLTGWVVAGDAWWLQPFNLSTFAWLAPALPLGLAAALARRWDVLAWLGVPIAAFAWIYGTAFLPPGAPGPPGAPPADDDLVVASFNTWVHSPGVGHVVDLVEEVDADVLVALEVFPAREQELRDALGDLLPETAVAQSEGVGGVMVLSAHPIVGVVDVPAIEGARRSLVATLDVAGTPVQVAPVHLRSPCPECGTSVVDRLTLEGRSRTVEVAAVLDTIDPDVPAIVGGDLNSTARSMAYRQLTGAGFRDPQREAGAGLGPTWPADGAVPPLVRIDWILVRGLEPTAAWVEPGGPSDHRAVVARLRLPVP